MRLSLLSPIAVALLGEIQSASAQSPTSYPWCAKYYESWNFSSISCYYITQAMNSAGRPCPALGGVCIHSPYYRGRA
jgi:hypothetical protein